MQAWEVKIRGIVQGVGFRPFIHRLVREFGLRGSIRNTSSGVTLELEGETAQLEAFLEKLPETAPPLAVIEDISHKIKHNMLIYYVGDQCPSYAEDYFRQSSNASSTAPKVLIEDTDFAAIYFSSGTTGFPKPILLKHQALSQSAAMEAGHHKTTKNDCFLCIPPLYHTGAKMHWFGSLYTGSRAVLLKGNTPKSIFQAVSNEGCTIVWLLVPWAQDILAELDAGRLRKEDYQLQQRKD